MVRLLACPRFASLRRLCVLITLSMLVGAGCATTSTKKSAATKRAKDETPRNYGLYTTKDIDQKLLRRGEQIRWSRSLDGY